MEEVPTELYHVDEFRDDLSRGKRLYRSDDRVYESRDLGEAGARIYADTHGWRIKLRFPETDDAAAWDIYNDLVDRAPDDLDLGVDQRSFHTALEEDGHLTVQDSGTTLGYNRESRFSLPSTSMEAMGGSALTIGEYVTKFGGGGGTLGALLGGGLGTALGGPAGTIPGAALGGALGGCGGTFASVIKMDLDSTGSYRRRTRMDKKKERWRDRLNDLRSRRIRRKDAPGSDLLEDINRRNALQTILPESDDYRPGANTELDRLEGRELNDTFRVLMDLHFRSYEALPGVTLTTEVGTYGEAVDILTTYLGRDAVAVAEPSLYTDPAAFRTMLSHLTYEDGGEQELTEGGEALIANAIDRDDRPDAVDSFIDSRYDDHLREIAFDR